MGQILLPSVVDENVTLSGTFPRSIACAFQLTPVKRKANTCLKRKDARLLSSILQTDAWLIQLGIVFKTELLVEAVRLRFFFGRKLKYSRYLCHNSNASC